MGKVFPKTPVRNERAMRESNTTTISREMFDTEREKLTDKLSVVNIL